VWSEGTRTLTATAASTIATLSGSNITCKRGDSLSAALTGLGSLANRSKLYFTVKRNEADVDTASIVQIEETAGLVYLNGASSTAGNGSLTVNDATAGDITIVLKAAATAELPLAGYVYDIQIVRSSGTPVSTLSEAAFTVDDDITRAIT
jgi:hypothetical protein